MTSSSGRPDAAFDPLTAFRLDGAVAVVTGASSGRGARFARVLDGAGARVVITARRADRLEELAAELHDPVVLPGDMSDPEWRASLIDSVVERAGRLDVLVNNAGRSEPMRALDETVDHFRDTLELNLVAPTWSGIPKADIVFLRNVMIYFDVPTRRQNISAVSSRALACAVNTNAASSATRLVGA